MEIIHDQTPDTGLAAAQKILEYDADRMTITVIVPLRVLSEQEMAGTTQRGRAGSGGGVGRDGIKGCGVWPRASADNGWVSWVNKHLLGSFHGSRIAGAVVLEAVAILTASLII